MINDNKNKNNSQHKRTKSIYSLFKIKYQVKNINKYTNSNKTLKKY